MRVFHGRRVAVEYLCANRIRAAEHRRAGLCGLLTRFGETDGRKRPEPHRAGTASQHEWENPGALAG
jgi:hypothetical protein